METMAVGMLAGIALILSACCVYAKRPLCGLIGSVMTAALTIQTGYCWKSMLLNSGKDTTLLGFARYPAALVLLALLLLAAVLIAAISIIGIVRRHSHKTEQNLFLQE